MRSEKIHLRNQTLIIPPLGQPNSNGDLLFCLTNVFSPSDKSPSFSLKQPPLSWVLRPYFLALVVGAWHSPGQIESSIPLEKGQGSSEAKDTLLGIVEKRKSLPTAKRMEAWSCAWPSSTTRKEPSWEWIQQKKKVEKRDREKLSPIVSFEPLDPAVPETLPDFPSFLKIFSYFFNVWAHKIPL